MMDSEVYMSDLKARAFPWPHVDFQDQVRPAGVNICWLPEGGNGLYPEGCWLLSYTGGGLHTVILPDETELFSFAIKAAAMDGDKFWSYICGRDITRPAPPVTPKRRGKPKAGHGIANLSLDDLGL